MSDYSMLINGEAVSADRVIEVVNPATEAVIATVPEASEAQLVAQRSQGHRKPGGQREQKARLKRGGRGAPDDCQSTNYI